jgi:hypothetical protein
MQRRKLIAAMLAAPVAAGVAARASASTPAGPSGFRTGRLDLTKPVDNLTGLLKLQADLAGKPVIAGFPGKAWAWVPGEGNVHLFNTYGIGASRLEWSAADEVWRLYHREVLYYCDAQSNEIMDSWRNPLTERRVEVLHILNDPVNRVYSLKPGPFAPPYPYFAEGDRLVFQLDILRGTEKSPMSRKDYPLHAQQDLYQSGELWAIGGSLAEVNDPRITSANCHTAWARVSMWLPFMEMGNRPGQMIYHSQSFKLMGGVADLPPNIRAYTEKHFPKYLEPPTEWTGLARNETTWSYSKRVIDERRAAGKVANGSVFGICD